MHRLCRSQEGCTLLAQEGPVDLSGKQLHLCRCHTRACEMLLPSGNHFAYPPDLGDGFGFFQAAPTRICW
ncbi:hypothetical protein GCM10027019_06260 [Melaminivora jejuensis]